MHRAYHVYGDPRYARLARLSVSHLYNPRHQSGYQATRLHWTKTRGHTIPIAERRAPVPEGRAGFIRIDSVHQGDQDGAKGLYHINAVDCLTQFELVATCEPLERSLLDARARRTTRRPPFCDPRLSHRQRLRIHQPHGGQAPGEAAHRGDPSRARATATTTPWPKPRTAQSCASTWATRTSHNASPRR